MMLGVYTRKSYVSMCLKLYLYSFVARALYNNLLNMLDLMIYVPVLAEQAQ